MASSNSIWASKSNNSSSSRNTQKLGTTRTIPIGSTFRLSSAANNSSSSSTSTPSNTTKAALPHSLATVKLNETCTTPISVPVAETEYSMEQSMEYSLLHHEDAIEDNIDWMDVDVIDPAELARIDTMVQELRSGSTSTTKSLHSSQTSIWASSTSSHSKHTNISTLRNDQITTSRPLSSSSSSSTNNKVFRLDGKPITTNDVYNTADPIDNINIMAMDQEDASTNTLYIPSLDRESVSNTLSSSTQFLAKAYIVVDTNVLISHLCYIKELLERVRAVSIRLIVPWIVAQELDSLKRQEHIRTRVIKAIHFIHDTLHRGDPGLRGQKITEHLRKHTVNDDTILDCAQYFAAQSTSQPVLILSNDCNLRVKAMVHELCVWQCDEGSPEKLVNYLIAHYSSVATSTPASSNTMTVNVNKNQNSSTIISNGLNNKMANKLIEPVADALVIASSSSSSSTAAAAPHNMNHRVIAIPKKRRQPSSSSVQQEQLLLTSTQPTSNHHSITRSAASPGVTTSTSALTSINTNHQLSLANPINCTSTTSSFKSLMLEINAQSLTMLTPLFKRAISTHPRRASFTITSSKEWDLSTLFALASTIDSPPLYNCYTDSIRKTLSKANTLTPLLLEGISKESSSATIDHSTKNVSAARIQRWISALNYLLFPTDLVPNKQGNIQPLRQYVINDWRTRLLLYRTR